MKVMPSPKTREEGTPTEAAAAVFAMDYLLTNMVIWCAARAPDTIPAVQQAGREWHERHKTLSAKSRHILQTRLTPEEKDGLLGVMQRENDRIIEKLANAPQPAAQQMCPELPAKMTSPQLDLTTHTTLVKTLSSYPDR